LALVCLMAMSAATFASREGRTQEIASDWVEGERNRVRLTAGAVDNAAPGVVMAFIELALDKGWKTYWRNPGTAGGIPPVFDWSKSTNVAAAEVLFPVPRIMSDKAGDVIGYREFVVFPVRIVPKDPNAGLLLDVTASYGICEKLCVPAEANLVLSLPPGPLPPAGADALAALEAVPRAVAELRPGDPSAFKMEKASPSKLSLSARFPGSPEAAAMFLDVADGRYLPLPARRGVEADTVAFEVDLGKAEELVALKGTKVRVTMKGDKGQSETAFTID
jgi:DsbC/DsbD-like thiol-disulfide interchange protein